MMEMDMINENALSADDPTIRAEAQVHCFGIRECFFCFNYYLIWQICTSSLNLKQFWGRFLCLCNS